MVKEKETINNTINYINIFYERANITAEYLLEGSQQ